ncbi:MAG: BPTD_3080 family restriction endonuclease, partial [Spirochaetaceae bacterium]
MSAEFFEHPILNNPYERPGRHWELEEGQPTGTVIEKRRPADFITPIPKSKKQKQAAGQGQLGLVQEAGGGVAAGVAGGAAGDTDGDAQGYDPKSIINEIRAEVERWRKLPRQEDWGVTPETARLLDYWRNHEFHGVRPFFCQVEAVETAIWLAEVAPQSKHGRRYLDYIEAGNAAANPGLTRIALKLATGAGKTTVMAMIIAWQTVNAVRRPQSPRFTRGFLIVTPGITIKNRLEVLLPSDPNNYYREREIVPPDLLESVQKAKVVITNYHAFKLRERMQMSKAGRALMQGRRGDPIKTTETEGQMIQRVMSELMGLKNVLVLNDEAHHCYREKPESDEELDTDRKKEAEANNEAARLWITGIETVKRKLGVRTIYDLSATPFFLAGSGYREGTLFPWTVSDFSLMDAIECGIVKLPRVPVSDNIPDGEVPKFRRLWEHIRTKMPKKGRAKAGQEYDPLNLPVELQTALDALYGHYETVYEQWREAGMPTPPVFIIVANNTSSSKLIYDYISGFERETEGGERAFHAGRYPLFRNHDEAGEWLARPRTLLIDSEQLESGEALDATFRQAAAEEIEQFKRDLVERTGDRRAADTVTDEDLLREAMNTVGKPGRLGEPVRCVVSVSMLTEGWDANSVTHILGVRAFGTQLLCEQVVGRALRRQSYDLNAEGLFDVEYADVLGIPFDFTARAIKIPPKPPKQTITVQAVRPERDALEITFPRVEGYRVEFDDEELTAEFTPDSTLELTPDLVGSSQTRSEGIIGRGVDLTLDYLESVRRNTIIYELTKYLLYRKFRDAGEEPKLHLFGRLKQIVARWMDEGYLVCKGGTRPAQLLYAELAAMAAERIFVATRTGTSGRSRVKAVLDAYNPTGSTRHVSFTTSKELRWQTRADKSHVNYVICDSGWECSLPPILEAHPRVVSYVKNHNLGFEVPYRMGGTQRRYIPDFIVRIDDRPEAERAAGGSPADPLNLVIEVKGFRGEDAKEKANTMKTYWVPGVNNLGSYGRWEFAEFTEVWDMEEKFQA